MTEYETIRTAVCKWSIAVTPEAITVRADNGSPLNVLAREAISSHGKRCWLWTYQRQHTKRVVVFDLNGNRIAWALYQSQALDKAVNRL